MDSNRFDLLVKYLVTVRTRRGVLHVLATLPFLGGLAVLFGEDETEAKGRRKRRRKRHKHGQGRPKNRRKRKRGDIVRLELAPRLRPIVPIADRLPGFVVHANAG